MNITQKTKRLIKFGILAKRGGGCCLYDAMEKKFFAFPGYSNFLTEKQQALIIKTIEKIK